MSYRDIPSERAVVCDVTSSTELHMLNGSIAEFSIPCNYVVDGELVPIQLVSEGYSEPVLAVDVMPEGLTWFSWIDTENTNLIKLVISAQCPAAITRQFECNVSLLITRVVEGLGERTDAVIRGPLLIEAAPIAGGSINPPELPEQTVASASRVAADTTAFNGILSTADTDLQKALETLDDHTHPVTAVPEHEHVWDDLPPWSGTVATSNLEDKAVTAPKMDLFSEVRFLPVDTNLGGMRKDLVSSTVVRRSYDFRVLVMANFVGYTVRTENDSPSEAALLCIRQSNSATNIQDTSWNVVPPNVISTGFLRSHTTVGGFAFAAATTLMAIFDGDSDTDYYFKMNGRSQYGFTMYGAASQAADSHCSMVVIEIPR